MNRIKEQLAGLTPEQRVKLAAHLKKSRSLAVETIKNRPSSAGHAPLSCAQERLWLVDQLNPDVVGQNTAGLVTVHGEFDAARFERALRAVQSRHEVLRTAIRAGEQGPVQVVMDAPLLESRFIDIADIVGNSSHSYDNAEFIMKGGRLVGQFHDDGDMEADCLSVLNNVICKEGARPFDFESGCLVRLSVIRLHDKKHYVLLTLHHVVFDGGSVGLLMDEIWAAYVQQEFWSVPPLSVQYGDYAFWQRETIREGGLDRGLTYWEKTLEGMPQYLSLSTGCGDGGQGGSKRVPIEVSRDIFGRVQRYASNIGVTPFHIFLAAYACVISRFSGEKDFAIGIPVSLRNRPELNEMIGCFINMLAIRMDLRDSPSFEKFVLRVRDRVLEAMEYVDTPFEFVVSRVAGSRDSDSLPVFQNTFSFEREMKEGICEVAPGLGYEVDEFDIGNSGYDLDMEFHYGKHGVEGWIDYDVGQFDDFWIYQFVNSLLVFVDEGLSFPENNVDRLPLLTESQREEVTGYHNIGGQARADHILLHELFEAQVARTPGAVAVCHSTGELTYAQLNERANQLAHRLRALKTDSGLSIIQPDAPVALSVERSPEMVIGLLGILKSGAAYLPVDPEYPVERIEYMLMDSQARVLVTQRHVLTRLPKSVLDTEQIIILDDETTYEGYSRENISTEETGQTACNLAYVIYTSGSTGLPKGVMNEHRGVVNRLLWMPPEIGMQASDRILQKTSFAFDGSVWELYWTLVKGAAMVLARPGGHRDPGYLIGLIDEQRITMVDFVPSMLQVFLDFVERGQCGSIRHILCGSEELPLSLLQRAQRKLPHVRFHNLYGPTEAAADAVYWTCDAFQRESRVPIGRPIDNIRIYILDENRLPVPRGVTGELYIGGEGVARGYLNRPELTAERFVQDPFSDVPDARMYRTGDLGRWRSDGAIEYLGRNDFQVKIRGLRIELGEIEARLCEIPGIREAVVVAREDRPGDKRLVAYWTGLDSDTPLEGETCSGVAVEVGASELRERLKAELPEYMVPSAFVKLDAMPLTPNGKVDRKALPAPDAEALVTHTYEAPQGPVEEVLAGIWQELLGVEKVGRYDNFFDLGGHSLLIVSMVERLRKSGLQAGIRMVFDALNLAELASNVRPEDEERWDVPRSLIPEGCRRVSPEMLPLVKLKQEEIDGVVAKVPEGAVNVQDIYPLSPLQQGVLFYHRLHEKNDPYVTAFILRFDSEKLLEDFASAINVVVSRHDAFRTAVFWEGLPCAVQVVCRHADLFIESLDIAAKSKEEEALVCIKEYLDDSPFVMDLGRAPLLRLQRVNVVGLSNDGHDLCYGLLTIHHVISDHVSMDVMMSEAVQILEGHEEALQEPVAYREFVAHSLDEEREAKAIAFFRQMLGDVDGQTAPFGLTDVHGDGTGIEELRRPLDDGLSQRIRACVRRLGTSAATLFHVAYGLVLARCASRDDVVFGSVLSGRMGGVAGADRTVGMFINTLPVRLKLKGADVLGAMHAMQTALVDLLKYEQTSLAQVQRGSGLGSDVALFSAMLNFRHSQAIQGAGKRSGIEVVGAQERTNYPFVVSVDDLGEGFALTAQTQARVVEPERVLGYMSCAVAEVVDALENAPHRELLSLEVVPQAERELLIHGFNATQAAYPKDALIHELFEQQVERTPEAVAVQYEGQSLTYAALNVKANQLAHWLLDHGAGRGQCVAIVAPRGIPMLLGQLATLKAGGTYVPIDPEFPQERRLFMLQDCRAKVVLSGDAAVQASDTAEAGQDVQWLDLGHALQAVAGLPVDNPAVPKAECAEAAYVMYTSGSTGQPKGVMAPHRGVNRLVFANGYADITPEDVLAHFSNPAFDGSTFETWGALLNGARVVIVPQETVLDPVRFGQLLLDEGVTTMFMTIGLFHQYADALAEPLSRLKYLLTGGDVIEPNTIRRVLKYGAPENFMAAYGPTETTTFATTCRLNDLIDGGSQKIPLGRPIGNTQIYILDGQGQPVPIGVTGEIHIGGDGVALGYLNRPELTAERFVPDPFSDEPDARMYRTGDLGYWRADGLIEFMGRNDFQVKVRGFRIELGEIEARLGELAEVKEVVVLAREDHPGDKRLVAYWTARDGGAADAHDAASDAADTGEGEETRQQEVARLREHLRAELPEYMVPSAFVRLEAMPLNTSGKVDRKALPAPDAEALVTHAYEAPQGPVEEVLAGIWQELLGVERVGRHDNFFDLGGHSLLIVSMVEKLRQAGFEADIRQVFDARSLVELAAGMGEQGATERKLPANLIPEGCDRITPEMLPLIELTQAEVERIVESVPGGAANVQDIYPLAPLQEGVLFYHHFHRDNDPYVISAIVSFTSQDWFQRFAGAMEKVISRHDALRTAVLWEGLPQAVQVVYRHAELEMEPLKIVAGSKETDTLTCIREHLEKTSLVMDPGRAPLLRLQPVHVAGGEQTEGPCYGLITFHHVILDHVSLDVLMSEAVQILEGHEEALQEPVAYREFVAHSLDEEREAKAIAFFRQMLGDVDGQTAPFGLTDVHGDGTGIEELRSPLDDGLSQRIRARVRRLGMSAATLFHVAYGLVLARCASRDDVVFGSVLSGRMGGVAGADRTVGMFINTLPVRLKLKGADVLGAMHAMQTALVDLLKYEQTSLAQVQRGSGLGSDVALFSAMLNFRHSQAMQEMEGRSGMMIIAARERTNYPFSVSVDDLGEGFALTAQTQARVVEPERVLGYMSCAVAEVVDALENAPDRELLSLEVVPQAEREQVIHGFNATQAAYPKDALIHELFEQQVERTPEALAVQYEGQSLTYSELNAKANQLAHWLLGHGAGRGQCVAIVAPRGISMLLGQLATLKAGGTYVPVDPEFPQERRLFMLQDCRAKVVLSGDAAVQASDTAEAGQDVQWLDLGHALQAVASLPADNPAVPKAECAEAAYVMYTSGSTGKPKGVAVPHRAISRLVMANGFAELTADDVVVHCSNTAFDASTLEVWGALLNGGRMLVVSHDQVLDTVQFGRIMQEGGATVLYLSAGLFNQVADQLAEVFAQLRYLIVGGDVLDASVIRRVLRNSPPQNLLNGYGPTETTTFAVTCRLNDLVDETTRQVPIGRPIGNTQVYILDGQGQPVPIGVTGEIHIGGDGVALGYLNRPDLTAERFVPDPFGAVSDARMYRTGDLGYWRADGLIELVGRNDFQVKVRGFRIELGEIEARLGELPEVKEVVVLAREDQPGDKRLVAYWTARDDDAAGTSDVEVDTAYAGEDEGVRQRQEVERLRDHLRAELPEYMVPSAFVRLEAMPLNTSGKVDRKALPAPDAEALVTHAYEAPQGPVEEVLAGIWQELLGVERVGRHDNFFDLGGHSLLVVTMLQKLRQIGMKLEIQQVFQSNSLAVLTQKVEEHGSNDWKAPVNLIPERCNYITPEMLTMVEFGQWEIDRIASMISGGMSNIQDIYPLAPLQEGVLFHHRLFNDNDPYVLSGIVSFRSQCHMNRFVDAMEKVVARHDALRTAILWDGLPYAVQVVQRRVDQVLEPLEISGDGDDLACIRAYLKEADLRMDLGSPPLMVFRPVRILGKKRRLDDPCYGVVMFHHVILDHVSLDIMEEEVIQILEGRGDSLPKPIPYRGFVAHSLDRRRGVEADSYFQDALSNIDTQTAPFGMTDVHGNGSGIEELGRLLDDELSRRIRTCVRRLRTSAATLFHVAYGLVLAKCTSLDDVVFGSVLSGRMGDVSGSDRMMGMFINTLPVRFKIGNSDVFNAMRSMQGTLVNLQKHEQTSLVTAQRHSGIGGDVALFSAILNFRHSYSKKWVRESREGASFIDGRERTNYPFVVSVDDLGEGFALTAQTQARVVEPERVLGYMSCAVAEVVDALENAPHRELLSLEVVPQAERELLIHGFNATQAAYPKDALIHELFEQQVERTPEALAVQYEGQSLTYSELNAKANQLAHWLLGHGAGRGQCVAIVAPRGISMLLGQLATLKAGGTYVPVDPEFPQERRLFMLQDCRAKVVLSGDAAVQASDTAEAGQDVQWLDLGHALQAVASLPADNPAVPKAECAEAAYVMYTSGSTGKPKGVAVPHRAISRLVMANGFAELTADDVVVHCSNTAFDASTLEVWGALLNGGRMLVVSHDQVLDTVQFGRIMQEGGATVLYLSAGLFNQVADQLAEVFAQLRYLIVGGDVLDASVIRRVLRNSPPQNLLNGYGPTETTTFAVTCRLNDLVDETTRQVPIGRPIGNTQVYILDGQGQPVPIGVTGEIHIGGDGVALGYLNRPDLTAERFVPDPFGAVSDARMYRTGDLGYWRADGLIELVGRNDFQVKVRGFRIELGEIEARLGELPEVKEVVVLAREDQPGDKRLVAYWTARDDDAAGTSDVEVDTAYAGEDEGVRQRQEVERLRDHLRAELPEYMVPSAFVRLEAMPLNTSGKVDRKALPAPDAEALVTHAYEAPQGPVEEVLAGIWQELLGVERVGRHDNFFDLGGHSLLVMSLLEKMAKWGFNLRISQIFDFPTIAMLSASFVNEISQCCDSDCVVAMRQGDVNVAPIFLIHDGGGDVLSYTGLMGFLSSNVPVYGVRALGVDPDSGVFSSIEKMASYYIASIKKIRNHGPFRFAGWSMGGVVAYEMARQLTMEGDDVEFVVMIDSFALGNIDNIDRSVSMKSMAVGFISFMRSGIEKNIIERMNEMQCVDDVVQECYRLGLEPSGMSRDVMMRTIRTLCCMMTALNDYHPESYEGDTYLFLADKRSIASNKTISDEIVARGWKNLGRSMPKSFRIGGDHYTIMKPPYLRMIADKINGFME